MPARHCSRQVYGRADDVERASLTPPSSESSPAGRADSACRRSFNPMSKSMCTHDAGDRGTLEQLRA